MKVCPQLFLEWDWNNYISEMPIEILQEIFTKLPFREQLDFSHTCRTFQAVALKENTFQHRLTVLYIKALGLTGNWSVEKNSLTWKIAQEEVNWGEITQAKRTAISIRYPNERRIIGIYPLTYFLLHAFKKGNLSEVNKTFEDLKLLYLDLPFLYSYQICNILPDLIEYPELLPKVMDILDYIRAGSIDDYLDLSLLSAKKLLSQQAYPILTNAKKCVAHSQSSRFVDIAEAFLNKGYLVEAEETSELCLSGIDRIKILSQLFLVYEENKRVLKRIIRKLNSETQSEFKSSERICKIIRLNFKELNNWFLTWKIYQFLNEQKDIRYLFAKILFQVCIKDIVGLKETYHQCQGVEFSSLSSKDLKTLALFYLYVEDFERIFSLVEKYQFLGSNIIDWLLNNNNPTIALKIANRMSHFHAFLVLAEEVYQTKPLIAYEAVQKAHELALRNKNQEELAKVIVFKICNLKLPVSLEELSDFTLIQLGVAYARENDYESVINIFLKVQTISYLDTIIKEELQKINPSRTFLRKIIEIAWSSLNLQPAINLLEVFRGCSFLNDREKMLQILENINDPEIKLRFLESFPNAQPHLVRV